MVPDCPCSMCDRLCRAKNEPYIASMGIYVLKASAIRDLLSKHFPEVCQTAPAAPPYAGFMILPKCHRCSMCLHAAP